MRLRPDGCALSPDVYALRPDVRALSMRAEPVEAWFLVPFDRVRAHPSRMVSIPARWLLGGGPKLKVSGTCLLQMLSS